MRIPQRAKLPLKNNNPVQVQVLPHTNLRKDIMLKFINKRVFKFFTDKWYSDRVYELYPKRKYLRMSELEYKDWIKNERFPKFYVFRFFSRNKYIKEI